MDSLLKRLTAGWSLLRTVIGGVAATLIIFSFLAYGNLTTARESAFTASHSRAASYGDLFNTVYNNAIRTANGIAAVTPDQHGQQFSRDALTTAFYQNMQTAWANQPGVQAGYLFDTNGRLLSGLKAVSRGLSSTTITPRELTARGHGALAQALAAALAHGTGSHLLSFAGDAGRYGDLYLFQPVVSYDSTTIGAVVLRMSNDALAGHFLSESHVALVAPPFILDAATPGLVAQRRINVLRDTATGVLGDQSLLGGLKPVSTTDLTSATLGRTSAFRYGGADQLAGVVAPGNLPAYHVVAYDPAPSFWSAFLSALTGLSGLVLLLLLIAGGLLLTLMQRNSIKAATSSIEESRSAILATDVLNLSHTLAAARDGDLTVEAPSADSEVGLISVMINGLLDDYSATVAGIIRASEAVQDGALRVDEGVRSIVDVATRQGERVSMTAGTVGALAASATEVQEATRQATALAAEAFRSVCQGQDAVGRVGEAVDAIKEAAIGTTREFKHLQEDSIRLTALVSSVKSNAENLDMQAANATLEARHLGTETGSAFATNIGRLARQAQETLTDAETAVRSVVTSIDAVNRRIERISEQVRLGVDEVRSIRGAFEGITTTNEALVEYIDQVDGSAHTQAESAQSAATAITTVAAAFQQFNDLLVASSDEMASMRLVVADLQESVANLTVDETLLAEKAPAGVVGRAA